MTEQFVMKVVMAIVVIALGLWLLIHHRDLQAAKKMWGSGWKGDLDEMRSGKDNG